MPISEWLNPSNLGEKLAIKWINLPSSLDPTYTNGEMTSIQVLSDIQAGRSMSKSYVNPVKDALRKGLVKGFLANEGTIEEAENAIRQCDITALFASPEVATTPSSDPA
ncbi:MAG: hypothetical protein AAB557_05900 [Patescibacteria group bacterium]